VSHTPTGQTATPGWTEVEQEALRHFKNLLRIDTTNPPGNEHLAIAYIAGVLREAGIEPTVVESAPGRANLVARIKGNGTQRPLLLAGHVDVVPADPSHWRFDPFAAEEADGHIWARGAIDMKNMVAMSMMVALLLKREGASLARDIIFCAVADEENGCDYGSKFMVEKHADLVKAEYMLGEIGGFTQYTNGVTIYPIQVAEKGFATLKMTAVGEPGHASMPQRNSAVVKLARAIAKIGSTRLPQHNLPVVEAFVRGIAETQKAPAKQVLPMILNPRVSNFVLDNVLPDKGAAQTFNALLRNTASPTMSHFGTKVNVIPGEASCTVDGRLLPGFYPHDLVAELEALTGDDVKFEVIARQDGVISNPDTPLMGLIKSTLKKHDPEGYPVPYMIPGFTDASQFAKLGMTCYGFSPLKLPRDADYTFSKLFHGHNERIPTDGFLWGLRVLYETVKGFCAG
jgi:acetylornithine deacetylase/succinyl-diaminopimelate desuccinylase-like protein